MAWKSQAHLHTRAGWKKAACRVGVEGCGRLADVLWLLTPCQWDPEILPELGLGGAPGIHPFLFSGGKGIESLGASEQPELQEGLRAGGLPIP